jgi:hypothetical protein
MGAVLKRSPSTAAYLAARAKHARGEDGLGAGIDAVEADGRKQHSVKQSPRMRLSRGPPALISASSAANVKKPKMRTESFMDSPIETVEEGDTLGAAIDDAECARWTPATPGRHSRAGGEGPGSAAMLSRAASAAGALGERFSCMRGGSSFGDKVPTLGKRGSAVGELPEIDADDPLAFAISDAENGRGPGGARCERGRRAPKPGASDQSPARRSSFFGQDESNRRSASRGSLFGGSSPRNEKVPPRLDKRGSTLGELPEDNAADPLSAAISSAERANASPPTPKALGRGGSRISFAPTSSEDTPRRSSVARGELPTLGRRGSALPMLGEGTVAGDAGADPLAAAISSAERRGGDSPGKRKSHIGRGRPEEQHLLGAPAPAQRCSARTSERLLKKGPSKGSARTLLVGQAHDPLAAAIVGASRTQSDDRIVPSAMGRQMSGQL